MRWTHSTLDRSDEIEPAVKDVFTSSEGNIRFTRNPQSKAMGFFLNSGRVLNLRSKKTGDNTH